MKRLFICSSFIIAMSLAAPAYAKRFSQEKTADGQEIVKDSKTGLQWTATYATGKNWAQAMSYCADLTFGGIQNWRLPTKNELEGLISTDKSSPASDFPNSSTGWFWSSTSYSTYTDGAWIVHFDFGLSSNGNKNNFNDCRCVSP